jgi:putative ABC transport system permease protein
MRPLMLLRWSLRDLRRTWLQVIAIALVIAIGTGVYAALGSTGTWRRQSNDASFEVARMYDLRVRVAEGVDAPMGSMQAVLASLPDPSVVVDAEERLIVPTQVDASTETQSILVPGRIIGVDLGDNGPHVNDIVVDAKQGRDLVRTDDGRPTALIERNFADFYDLDREGEIRIAGGAPVRYVGVGLAPEYFFVMTDDGAFFAEANFAAVFTSLTTAQQLADRVGRVNDLVVRLRAGTDPVAVAGQLRDAFDADATGAALGVTVMTRADEDAYRVLYDDIDGDAKFWNVFAALILAGAAFGSFNLSSRMVDAQRRQIGIGMALGQSPRELAVRPMLVGIEIAIVGVVLGLAVGVAAMFALRPAYTSILPLPIWHTPFQPGLFARAAVLGFVLPVAATAWPVARAVRVTPLEAITTTHRSARGGLAPLLRRIPWPVSAFRRMPLGNLLRTPRRTALTALGIGAAISTLVAILGMLDSFLATMDRNDREVLAEHPDRVEVALDGFVSVTGPQVSAIAAVPSVGAVQPVIRVGGRLDRADAAPPGGGESADGSAIEVILDVMDFDTGLWAPSLISGNGGDRSGIIIARKAADDLDVQVGDHVVLEHPERTGAGFIITHSTVTVAGIHPSPFRFYAYLDTSGAGILGDGAEMFANRLFVVPAQSSSVDEVKRDLFGLDGVASALPVAASAQIVRDSLADFTAVFRVLEAFILALAILIAYNATSINADERARERATLFAFGLPMRRVIMLEVVEGVLYGLLGTLIGVGVGLIVVRWLITGIAASTMPDMQLDVVVSATTIGTAAVLGVVAVAVAPLLTIRRLRRMDLPGTLRVVE